MILESLKGKVIVSSQAMPKEPFYDEKCMLAMMKDVVTGGAAALRVAGVRDVINAKELGVPVIGLTKPDELPDNWKSVVYITPTVQDVMNIIKADADIVAFDGTKRPRPDNCSLSQIIELIHFSGKLAMADISTYEEGMNASKLGADIISTTLAGYTEESANSPEGPDFELLKKLVSDLEKPVFLEGRIWSPQEVKKAFELGAYSVVIGSAITRPRLITQKFVEGV